jgi:Uncharacterized protein conserved in bacteria (DUF2188)
MANKDVHTTPPPGATGWANHVGGTVMSTHRTKDAPVKAGRDLARESNSEHVIHK